MRRVNCNLELSLFPFPDSDNKHHSSVGDDCSNERMNKEEQQQLTIFYSGNVCVCDVTDFQARAILSLASKETEDQFRKTPTGSSESGSASSSPIDSSSYKTLSMKRSLQRFLQKRKHRIQATCPYNMDRRVPCRVDH